MRRVFHPQAGIALAVTLIMLGLLSLVGISAVMLGTTHFRLVGNWQASAEVEAAVRSAMESYVCEKSGAVCAPMIHVCKSFMRCVNGKAFEVRVQTRCMGTARDLVDGVSLSGGGVFDTYWDIQGSAALEGPGTGVVHHLGVVVPGGGGCPAAPAAPPSCDPPAPVNCD